MIHLALWIVSCVVVAYFAIFVFQLLIALVVVIFMGIAAATQAIFGEKK